MPDHNWLPTDSAGSAIIKKDECEIIYETIKYKEHEISLLK